MESLPVRVGVDEETMKELSLSGSSSGVNEEHEADSGDGEDSGEPDGDGDDDVEEIAEPPAKKARVQTRAKGKAPMVLVKKEKVKNDLSNCELVVPKKIDFKLLERLGIAKGVRENFRNIGWEKFLNCETASYEKLMKDFYEELHVEMNKEGPKFIKLRLRKVEQTVKISDLNIALKMVDWVDVAARQPHPLRN